MTMITVEIYGDQNDALPAQFAEAIQRIAVFNLHTRAEQLTISVAFSKPADKWFFNLQPLDVLAMPSFYVFAPIGKGTATDVEVAQFVVQAREELKQLMRQAYPGTNYPDLPDRTKIAVVEMA